MPTERKRNTCCTVNDWLTNEMHQQITCNRFVEIVTAHDKMLCDASG